MSDLTWVFTVLGLSVLPPDILVVTVVTLLLPSVTVSVVTA